MNDAVAANVKPPFSSRTKVSQWRSPSRKILLTENLEMYCGPAWNVGVPLARRHGIGISRGNWWSSVPRNGTQMGMNVSAAFIDGHAEGINDDFALRLWEAQASAQ